MTVRPIEDELFHTDRPKDSWTNMTKLTVAFRSLSNALTNDKGFDRHLLRIAQSPSFGLQD